MRHASEEDEGVRGLVECLPRGGHVASSGREEQPQRHGDGDGMVVSGMSCWDDEGASALVFALDLLGDGSPPPGVVDGVFDREVLGDCVRRKLEQRYQNSVEYVHDEEQMEKEENNGGLVIEMGECDAVSRSPVGPFTVCGIHGFSSLRSNVSVPRHGKWLYEVHVRTSGIMQLGWVTPLTVYTSEDGVGDSRDSFAYDGKRKRKWNVASTEYGEQWTSGDVISCGIDFETGVVEYWRNGVHLGVAYSSSTLTKEDPQQLAYFPGVSVSYAESCEINFGNLEFRYPVKGYKPVLEGHDARRRAFHGQAKYLADSLERLTIIGEAKNRAASPRAAAAYAASHAVECFCGSDDDDDAVRGTLPQQANTGQGVFAQTQEYAARILFSILGDMLRDEGIVDSVFVESCRRMLSYDHTGSALTRYLEMVGICLSSETCRDLVHALCVCCGRRVRGNIWTREDDPESCDAVVYSMIWYHVMKNDTLARFWVSLDDWRHEFEDFFFVRQPTNEDLEMLIPTSLDDDIENVLDKIIGVKTEEDSESGLLNVVTELVCFLNRIDDVHALLLQQLMTIEDTEKDSIGGFAGMHTALDSSRVDDFLDAFEANQVTQAPRDTWTEIVMDVMTFCNHSDMYAKIPQHLCEFMKFIVQKNLGATREVTPPGLSHPSVLCSLLSFMTRASRKFLRKVYLEGSEFEYPRQAFLRGVRSALFGVSGTLDDDNLAPDERIGGGVSFLCKSSLVEVCKRSRNPLKIPAISSQEEGNDWTVPMGLRPLTVFEDDAPSWSWWILDSCFILYHLGAGQVIKKINTFMQTFEAAMSSFKTMVDKFSREHVDKDFMELSLKECKKTMMHSLRMLMWHLNWLMPRWKQQTFGALASTMSRVLLEIQKDTNTTDLSYVAGFYVENILEMILACRGPDVSWPTFQGSVKALFEPVLELCISMTTDSRVLNPHVQNSVLYSIWIMLRDGDTCSFVVQSEYAKANLLPCLIESFNHPRNWIHASNAFGLLVQNSGFAPRIGSEEESEDLKMYRATIRSWLGDILVENHTLGKKMFSSLIDRLNWISPELVVIIKDLHHQFCGPGSLEDHNLNYRRALAACDLLYHLLRLLELMCASDPDAVLSRQPLADMISTRLIEHISWGLGHFTGNSRVFKLVDEIHQQERLGNIRIGRDARPTMIAEILGPYIGIIMSLYLHSIKKSNLSPGDGLMETPIPTRDFMSFLEQLHDTGAVSGGLIQECLVSITNDAVSGLQRPTDAEMEHVSRIVEMLKYIDQKEQIQCKADGLLQEESVPEEFLDPILNVLMKDPVILPDSKVTLDRKTIQRHLTVSSTDPFSRCQLKEEDLIPNKELKKKVEDWLTLNSS